MLQPVVRNQAARISTCGEFYSDGSWAQPFARTRWRLRRTSIGYHSCRALVNTGMRIECLSQTLSMIERLANMGRRHSAAAAKRFGWPGRFRAGDRGAHETKCNARRAGKSDSREVHALPAKLLTPMWEYAVSPPTPNEAPVADRSWPLAAPAPSTQPAPQSVAARKPPHRFQDPSG
jgi:hypothetical protein